MLIFRHKFGKGLVKLLMRFDVFNRNVAVLTWDNSYLLRRTKPVEELIKNEISADNILELKYNYHSSYSVLKEYVAEIDSLNYEEQKLYLNIWSNEYKINLIRRTVLKLTSQTNDLLKKLIDIKVFNGKYGDDYSYFISLHLDSGILKAEQDNRQFSEITLKYSLRKDIKKTEMRHKSKFNISKDEARNLCSMISYWKK